MKSIFTGLFIGPAIFINQVSAQDVEVILPPIVVSASHIPVPLENTPDNITVITSNDIIAKNAINMIDLLRQIPGLHIDQLGGRGGISSVYLRGSDPNFTLVMIDGIKVNDPTNTRGGSFDFSTLDVNQIERIEIIHGPLSSVYGSDALGGVISIITRNGTQKPELSADFSGGGHGYYRTNLESRGPLGESGDYALNLTYTDNGTPVEGDEFQSKGLNLKLNLQPSDLTTLKWVMRYTDSHAESFPSDSGGWKFAVLREVDKRNIKEFTTGLDFVYELSPFWEYNLKLNQYQRQEKTVSPGVAPGVRDPFGIPANSNDNTFRRTHVVMNNLLSLSQQLRFSVGIEAQFEKGTSDNILYLSGFPVSNSFDIDRNIYSGFLEMQYTSTSGLTIQSGIRADAPEGIKTEFSPRLGVLYQMKSTDTTFKANWGQGFKLPSFFALASPIVGNPALRSETSESFDFGIGQNFWHKRINLSTNLFHHRFFDIIDFDSGPPPQLVNRSEVTAKGADLNLTIQPTKKLWITPHLTYVKTDIKGTDDVLRNRPQWRGGIRTRWHPKDNLTVNLDLLHVGKVFDSSIPTGDLSLSSYRRVDINTAWTLNPKLQITFAIDNMLDTDYEEVIGFPAPGIQVRLSTHFSFY